MYNKVKVAGNPVPGASLNLDIDIQIIELVEFSSILNHRKYS